MHYTVILQMSLYFNSIDVTCKLPRIRGRSARKELKLVPATFGFQRGKADHGPRYPRSSYCEPRVRILILQLNPSSSVLHKSPSFSIPLLSLLLLLDTPYIHIHIHHVYYTTKIRWSAGSARRTCERSATVLYKASSAQGTPRRLYLERRSNSHCKGK